MLVTEKHSKTDQRNASRDLQVPKNQQTFPSDSNRLTMMGTGGLVSQDNKGPKWRVPHYASFYVLSERRNNNACLSH